MYLKKCLITYSADGIDIKLNTGIGTVEKRGDEITVTFTGTKYAENEDNQKQTFDKLLIVTGRAPNVEGLGLEEIGVQIGKRGIVVNNKLQTHVKNIYAAGDVIGHYLFTHVAAFQAQLLIKNLLLPFSQKINYAVVPWTTFCDPEVARCGLTEVEARERYGDIDVFKLDQSDVDRAVVDGETQGFTKVIASKWKRKILGVHIIGTNAGEVLHEYVLAMQEEIPLRKLSGIMHVYPTYSTSVWRVAAKRQFLFTYLTKHLISLVSIPFRQSSLLVNIFFCFAHISYFFYMIFFRCISDLFQYSFAMMFWILNW